MDKTNAMRILDKTGISYEAVSYSSNGYLDGMTVAEMIGEEYGAVYKTLVLTGRSGKYYVCMIPVDKEIDFKKTSAVLKEKALCLISVNDINMVTGYEKGACSPIGMRKKYAGIIDAKDSDKKHVLVSAGRFGLQIKLDLADLIKITGVIRADICR